MASAAGDLLRSKDGLACLNEPSMRAAFRNHEQEGARVILRCAQIAVQPDEVGIDFPVGRGAALDLDHKPHMRRNIAVSADWSRAFVAKH